MVRLELAMSTRTIFVSGANQGLGFHTVHQLSVTPNTLVFLGSRNFAAAADAISKFSAEIHASSKVVPIQLDVTDDASIEAAKAAVSQTLQENNLIGLDVLINNAAVSVGGFQNIYAVNVVGAAALTTALRPLMNPNGSILNITSKLGSHSWHAERPPPPLYPAYSSSKSALNALTQIWAIEEEQKNSGIRVASICPGLNATNLNKSDARGGHPSEGCKVIVKAALEKGGASGVCFNKEGPIEW
ncbi:Short-chain dehydrogenase/reductase family protein [Mycena kentingensis (nom. inval.)]|nr:Short-chain dehydrogenase/reductase family protein [Mycena kentingensis (nom. inval.)]